MAGSGYKGYNADYYRATGQKVPTAQLKSMGGGNSSGGFNSSSYPMMQNNYMQGVNMGASSVLNPWGNQMGGQNGMFDFAQYAMNMANNSQGNFMNWQNQEYQRQRDILDLQYNQDLANNNQQYKNLFENLQRQQQKALSVANYQTAQLNPYSGPSSAGSGYVNKLNSEFGYQAKQLQDAANAAQEALRTGNTKAYLQLQSQMGGQQQQFQQNMNNLLLGIGNTMQQQQQFQYGALDKAQDNLRQFVQMSGVPEGFAGKTPDKWTMEEVMPYMQYAMSQGLQPQQAMQILPALLSGQTLAQQRLGQQQSAADSLNAYRDNQMALGWARLAASQDQMTQAQRTSNVIASVGAVPMPAYGSPQQDFDNYYRQVAQASAGGKADFRISQSFADMQSVLQQFPHIADSMEDLSNNGSLNPVFNIAAKVGTPFSTKVANLQGELNRVLPLLSRSFGEKGVLTEGDISRMAQAIGTVSQKAQVREKLYNELVDIMSEKYYLNLGSFARQGYDVSAYSQLVDTVGALRGAGKINTANTTTSGANAFEDFWKNATSQWN